MASVTQITRAGEVIKVRAIARALLSQIPLPRWTSE
jgi:hypothetical protein